MTTPAGNVQIRFLSNHSDVKNRKVTDGRDMVVIKRGNGREDRVSVREFISSSKYSDLGTPRDRLFMIVARDGKCKFTGTSRSGKIKVNVTWASPRPIARSLRSFSWSEQIKNACRSGRRIAKKFHQGARRMVCTEGPMKCALYDGLNTYLRPEGFDSDLPFCKGIK